MDLPFGENVECRSLYEDSWKEALCEKLYQSQRAGRDVGEAAIRYWVHVHWPGFLRARWIEHMLGIRFWVELKREEFGILRQTPVDLRPLLDSLIEQLVRGAENLDIFCWSRCKSLEERKAIRELLHLININAHRLRCHFSDD
jgi:hypothetical protein